MLSPAPRLMYQPPPKSEAKHANQTPLVVTNYQQRPPRFRSNYLLTKPSPAKWKFAVVFGVQCLSCSRYNWPRVRWFCSNLNELASPSGSQEQRDAHLEWAHGDAVMDEDYDVSVRGLAYGLKEHGGKLDGILTEAPEGARHDVVLGIDEVLARAEQSNDNLARGIVTPAAPFEEPA